MLVKGGADDRRECVSRLLARSQEAEQARLLMARLHGRRLPDVVLTTSESKRLPLLVSVSALIVMYFVSGETDETWIDDCATPDASQHRGYVNHRRSFEEMGVKIFGVSCQPEATLARIKWSLEATHTLFSDPELILGQALGLPTTQNGNINRYPRMALVASGGRVHKGVWLPFRQRGREKRTPSNDLDMRDCGLTLTQNQSNLVGKMLPSIQLPFLPGPRTNLLQLAKEAAIKRFSLIVCLSAGPHVGEMDTIRADGWRHYHLLLPALRCQMAWISTCPLDMQQEWAEKEGLRGLGYTFLSDTDLKLAQRLKLPTRRVDGSRVYEHATLVTHAGEITQVFSRWTLARDAHVVIRRLERAIDA
jgi:peroxiredoxin